MWLYSLLTYYVLTMRYQDPFEQMLRLFDHTARSMWGDPESMEVVPARTTDRRFGLGRGMYVQLEADDEGYTVRADLPGFEREDLSVRVDGDVLHIDAESEVREERDGAWSRHVRKISEQQSLPEGVIEDQIRATYRNGILEVNLPVERATDEDDGTETRIEIK